MRTLRTLIKAFAVLLLASCTARRPLQRPFDREGHRGCRGLMPENTIAAMRRAVDLGVTTLELDVVVTADSQLIVSHDPFFNHEISTAPDGRPISESEERSHNIYRMTYAETQRYDVGRKPHPRFPEQQKTDARKPLLQALIDSMESYSRGRIRYNIETKCSPATDGLFHPGPEAFAERLAAMIRRKGITDRATVQSFDVRTLQYIHRQYPVIRTVLLTEDNDTRSVIIQMEGLGFLPWAWSPHYSRVTAKAVRWCHRRGVRVIPWTVNEVLDMRRLLRLGADGLISDYPDRFAGL